MTFSRGGVLGLVAVIGLYAWRKQSVWLQGLMALLVVAGLILAGRFWTRGEDFSNLNEDVSFRQRSGNLAGRVWPCSPITRLLGVGLGCSVIAWPLYAPEDLYTRGALVTHNTFIQALGETGILGFIPFILFIGFGLYYARKLALESTHTGLANLGAGLEIAHLGICGLRAVGRICADLVSVHSGRPGVVGQADSLEERRADDRRRGHTPPRKPSRSSGRPCC